MIINFGPKMTLKDENKRPPVHKVIKVIDSMDLYKTDRWWKTVTLQESFGRKEIAIYLFLRRGDKWVRKQKFTIRSLDEWRTTKAVVDRFVEVSGLKNRATREESDRLAETRKKLRTLAYDRNKERL